MLSRGTAYAVQWIKAGYMCGMLKSLYDEQGGFSTDFYFGQLTSDYDFAVNNAKKHGDKVAVISYSYEIIPKQ